MNQTKFLKMQIFFLIKQKSKENVSVSDFNKSISHIEIPLLLASVGG